MVTPALLFVALVPLAQEQAVPVRAFPGAEGYGAPSVGGRGGRVIEVTNLNNSGPGSLRAACGAAGRRTVVFRVAGEIVITGSRIKVESPYLTIAGQTAPGSGITLRGPRNRAGLLMQFSEAAHDITIRYLRFRKGKGGEADNIQFRSGQNIILDHCSIEWSTDENIGIHPSRGWRVRNITIQRCLIAEALRRHSCGILTSDKHAPCSHLSIHHNLFAHNAHRNPRVGVPYVRVVNNVVYNWHSRVGNTHSNANVDFIGNTYKAGPWSNSNQIIRHEYTESSPYPSVYLSDNRAIPKQPDPDADNRTLIVNASVRKSRPPQAALLPKAFRDAPLPAPKLPETVQPAQDAYRSVLADVGANKRLNSRGQWVSMLDRVDRRIIEDVKKGTGPAQEKEIDHQDDFGGYPPTDPGTPNTDGDHDGMPDEWEKMHGFKPDDPSDGLRDADGDVYTNLEEFLNGTNPRRAEGGD